MISKPRLFLLKASYKGDTSALALSGWYAQWRDWPSSLFFSAATVSIRVDLTCCLCFTSRGLDAVLFPCHLFQVGSSSQARSLRLWSFSSVQMSHCSVPMFPRVQLTHSGSGLSTEPSPAVSPPCTVNNLKIHFVLDLQMENLKWPPTSPMFFSKSTQWIFLILDFISVGFRSINSQSFPV